MFEEYAAHANAVRLVLYERLHSMPLARESLKSLRDWTIVAATSRVRTETVVHQTVGWLRSYGIRFDGLHFGDKLQVRFDALTLQRFSDNSILTFRYVPGYNKRALGTPVDDLIDMANRLRVTDR